MHAGEIASAVAEHVDRASAHRPVALCALPMLLSIPPRLTKRALADIGSITIPRNLKPEGNGTYWTDEIGRLTFDFSSTYLWASMGSITTYREQRIVCVMAPDATAAEYASVSAAEEMLTRFPVNATVRAWVDRLQLASCARNISASSRAPHSPLPSRS